MPAERYAAKQLSPVNIQALNNGAAEYKGVMQQPDIGGGYLHDPDGVGGVKSGGFKGK